MTYSTALLILASIHVVMAASYAIANLGYALRPTGERANWHRVYMATVVGVAAAIAGIGTALRLGGL